EAQREQPKHISARPSVAPLGSTKVFDIRTIQVAAHHAHSLAVAPIKFSGRLFEAELLRSECIAAGDDGSAILTMEIGALDRTIVLAGNAHVGPVDVTRLEIDDDAVRDSAAVDDDFAVRAVGIYGNNPAADDCIEEKQTADRLFALWLGNLRL